MPHLGIISAISVASINLYYTASTSFQSLTSLTGNRDTEIQRYREAYSRGETDSEETRSNSHPSSPITRSMLAMYAIPRLS